MYRAALIPHSSTACPQVEKVEVWISEGTGASLNLSYAIEGDLGRLRIPARRAPRRADGLWRHTCLEAFLTAKGTSGYYEFNFAPSTEWAVYHFDDYRRGMAPVREIGVPVEAVRSNSSRLELDVCIHIEELSLISPADPIRLGLSAVIEGVDGSRSYWAVHHPLDQPDFHHPAGFSLPLDRN